MINTQDREVLRGFAHDILVFEGDWVREDAIAALRHVGEVGLKDATEIIDEVYGEMVAGMSPDDVRLGAEAAFQYVDSLPRLCRSGIITPDIAVEEVAGTTGMPKAMVWAIIVGVQNAAGCSLDLKKSPYEQRLWYEK